jgi:alpha-1,3-rhamnosyl/mannosyltransferase
MACGVPVASSTGGALAEVLGGAAVAFEPKDVEAMTNALETVLADDGERARVITAGAERARSYTWEGAGRSALAAFARVAA